MNLKTWILTGSVALVLGACSTSQPSQDLPHGIALVEIVEPSGTGINIPYKKYRLQNGLTVILHHDDSDPLVHVDVTYHVGSARERAGYSGFAHLFEHMMFQGSMHVADEQHFKLVTEAGGNLNGTTNSDRTNYFETVPANQLEKMLWLEADRMGFLLPALTDEKFEVQRKTVKNERAQRIDNQPYGRMSEKFNQALYPKGHPYSWPVIGWPEDLDRSTADNVKHFFQRWYGPNNATLTIGGDFDERQALAWVNKYFGEIPRGPEVANDNKTPVTLERTRYLSMEDKVHLPLLRVGIPTVYARHKDEPALDLLANILGGGKTSIFYKNLVKDGYAVQASVSHPCAELACELSMYAVANPARSGKLSDIEALIRESIGEFERRGVTDEDLQKVKVQFEADTIFGMQSVSGKVSTLAYNQTFAGNPNMLAKDLARYASVTKEDVMRVFERYIKDKPMVIMSVVPEGASELIAHRDNFEPEAIVIAKDAVAQPVALEPPQSGVDRSRIPAAGKAPVLKVPQLWTAKLNNGVEIMGTQSDETPTVELIIYLDSGHRAVAMDKAGLARLTAAMLNEASAKRSAEDLSQALEMLGASVEFGASGYQSYIKISCLSDKLDATLAIARERLLTPGFREADFARLKQQQLQSLQHKLSDPNYLARKGFAALLFGNSPLGVSEEGTVATVSALTLEDVKDFYAKEYRAGNASMIAVADMPKAQMLNKLQVFADWQGDRRALALLGDLPRLQGGNIYLLDKPGAAQSVITLGKRALPYDATGDYFKSYLMNYPLGGAFNSRINLNLREDKGYTYGASSSFNGGTEVGQFTVTASVRGDVTGLALAEIIKELKAFHGEGMTADELAFMRNSILQGEALEYETPYQKAGFMRTIQRYALPTDFTAHQAQIINQITTSELNTLAKMQLDVDEMVMLVVGDRVSIEAQLSSLGYPVTVLPL
jgi:zinc protease